MELLFIRHGHGEHLLDYPHRLNTIHPGLTRYGMMQVNQLRQELPIQPDDIILVSPTKRTIETAHILTGHHPIIISPLVGPRMFPQNPEFPIFTCDQIYSKDDIIKFNKDAITLDFDVDCWEEGINRIAQERFESYAKQLLDWCKDKPNRILIISHDGTITNYRILLGERGLTRRDFLGEAGVYKINI
ncbi:histidine phosphatase family protein [Paenibacillus marinisediminis]